MTIHSDLFERFGVRFGVPAEWSTSRAASAIGRIDLPTAVANEHELDLLLERRHVGDVGCSNAASAEYSDVRELVEVTQCDRSGLHATHREAGHRPVRLIGYRAIGAVHPRDQVIDEDP